jgi:ribose transport system permease protein
MATVRDWVARPTMTMLIILVGLVAVFSALEPDAFPTVVNLRGTLADAAILLVLAVGATFVIITAGIDLSVGSVLVFSSVLGAKTMDYFGNAGADAILGGLVVSITAGSAWGLLNGALVAKAKVPPFVVTLGTLGAAYGLSLVISGGLDVRSVPRGLVEFGNGRVVGVPNIALVAGAITLVAGLALALTVFGRWTYAIGSNEESARRAGIAVDRQFIAVYVLAGAMAGLGGFLSLARFGTTTIAGNTTTNLQVITAVVIGGTSLFGGKGWMLGTTIGVFIPIVLTKGFIIAGVQPYWQFVAVGVVLILAVLVDQRRRLRAAGR